jgi:hypothetical protein
MAAAALFAVRYGPGAFGFGVFERRFHGVKLVPRKSVGLADAAPLSGHTGDLTENLTCVGVIEAEVRSDAHEGVDARAGV